MIWSHQAVEMF